jgi:hypothetical protein
MTCDELRAAVKRLGGKPYGRITRTDGSQGTPRKADLVRILAGLQRAGGSEPLTSAPPAEPEPIDLDAAIRAALCELTWLDDEYRLAMRRVMTGTATGHHRRILAVRELQAIDRVRQSASITDRDWGLLSERFAVALAAIG